MSRSLAAPVKTTPPKENSTWTFYGRSTLISESSSITSSKLLPTGLIKQSKEGKEGKDTKEGKETKDTKETKEGKETKESKDTKEVSKDRKDGKEALSKETIGKEQDTVTNLRGLPDAEAGELSLEESQAREQAFIRPDERPDVGGNVMRAAGERQGRSR